MRVSDLDSALAFYEAALRPLGHEVVMTFPGAAGLGVRGKPDFWLTVSSGPSNPSHVAFAAERAKVDDFYEAALRAGARDNGAPGLREH